MNSYVKRTDSLLLQWQPHRLFPYERRLAAREVRVLLGDESEEGQFGISVPLNGHSRELFRRFTYFSHVDFPDGERIETDQWRLEKIERSRRAQSTRYSAHGLHEYKGKFNPQIVRAIGNVLGLERDISLLDPFCGSGTTLLECAHAGWHGAGLDLNPLAVFIANAKLTAIHTSAQRLASVTSDLLIDLRKLGERFDYGRAWTSREMDRLVGSAWEERVPNYDYLSSWFTPSVLTQFVLVFDAISRHIPERLRPIFLTVASDLVRDASLQEPADLRIRRRKDPTDNYPVVAWFVTAAHQRVDRIVAARKELGRIEGRQRAIEIDNRGTVAAALRRAGFADGFDAAITSPPYATALPYIDTQRLSLCLLGLIDARSIAARDRSLIGSREIGTVERLRLEDELLADTELPREIRARCEHLLERASAVGCGFRRRNVPALAYRYFRDMKAALASTYEVLSPGAPFALVVGRNRTTLGGEEIVIDTPRLLGELGQACHFRLEELVELNTYQRYDLHRRNSITSEWLLVLRRP